MEEGGFCVKSEEIDEGSEAAGVSDFRGDIREVGNGSSSISFDEIITGFELSGDILNFIVGLCRVFFIFGGYILFFDEFSFGKHSTTIIIYDL